MKTPFVILKEAGAPDAVLTALAVLMLVFCLSPWLGISIAGVTLKDSVPWQVSPVAALLLVLLFVPCIPAKKTASSAEKELTHRFHWIREHLLVETLTVGSAQEAKHALDGAGGNFRAAEEPFRDRHIEPILREATAFMRWEADVVQLRRLCRQLPSSWSPRDMVQPNLASELKRSASRLPTVSAAQGGAAADAATRRG